MIKLSKLLRKELRPNTNRKYRSNNKLSLNESVQNISVPSKWSNVIDMSTLKLRIKNKYAIDLGFITEYPDVTLFYIESMYSTSNKAVLVQSNGLSNTIINSLNREFKSNGLYLFEHEYSSSCLTVKLMVKEYGT